VKLRLLVEEMMVESLVRMELNHAEEKNLSVFKPLDLHGRYPQQGRRW
jgi:hypothetical protein